MITRMFVSAVLVLLCAISAWGAGDCDKSQFGHDETWLKQNAEGMTIDIRGCIDTKGMTHLDIRNPYDFDICVSVLANTSRKRWKDLVPPGMVLSKSVQYTSETWQVKAERETGNICPKPDTKPVHKKSRHKTRKTPESSN